MIAAIVPSAGLSRRFGGPNKLLQPWGDGTVVGAVAATLLSCGLEVIVVTGRDADLVAEAVNPARTIFNPRFEEGLGTSIAAGVEASPEADGYLIALGDMPGLSAEVVQRLVAALDSPQAILAPVYEAEQDRPGHPILFGAAYRAELMDLAGDEGARSVVQANRQHLRLIRVEGDLWDMDLPSDA